MKQFLWFSCYSIIQIEPPLNRDQTKPSHQSDHIRRRTQSTWSNNDSLLGCVKATTPFSDTVIYFRDVLGPNSAWKYSLKGEWVVWCWEGGFVWVGQRSAIKCVSVIVDSCEGGWVAIVLRQNIVVDMGVGGSIYQNSWWLACPWYTFYQTLFWLIFRSWILLFSVFFCVQGNCWKWCKDWLHIPAYKCRENKHGQWYGGVLLSVAWVTLMHKGICTFWSKICCHPSNILFSDETMPSHILHELQQCGFETKECDIGLACQHFRHVFHWKCLPHYEAQNTTMDKLGN